MKFEDLSISLLAYGFAPIEYVLRKSAKPNFSLTPIWIIGAPRSGTTLLYQIICTAFDASYLTNRVANRYRTALSVRAFERKFLTEPVIPYSFDSDYGKTNKRNDPHEGGQFFYQFFPQKQPYCTRLPHGKESDFVNIISEIAKPANFFVSKNTYHSLRIKALKKAFPQSKFLWVHRDAAQTVSSIIKARQKNQVSENEWWGINPDGWEEANNLPEIDKIIWQVIETEKIIKNDLDDFKDSFFKVNYTELCQDPKKMVLEISNKFGLKDQLRINSNLPTSFEVSQRSDLQLQHIKNRISTNA